MQILLMILCGMAGYHFAANVFRLGFGLGMIVAIIAAMVGGPMVYNLLIQLRDSTKDPGNDS